MQHCFLPGGFRNNLKAHLQGIWPNKTGTYLLLSRFFSEKNGFLGSSVVKNLRANAGGIRDWGLIPGSGRLLGEENGNPLQYSCLGNPKDRRA